MTATSEAGATALETRELRVEFGIRGGGVARAVDGVNLAVRRGEIIALVGESGSGKTTLARTILGLQRPTSGAVYVAGEALSYRSRALKAYRRRAQLILQDPSGALNPRHTVFEAVAEGLRVHGLHEGEEAKVADALSRAGLRPPERFYRRYPHELSGGIGWSLQELSSSTLRSLSPTSRCRASTRRFAGRSSPCCCGCATTWV